MTGYIGIGNIAKKNKNIYIGVGGVAKQVKKAYIGVNGVAKQWYSSTPLALKNLFSDMVLLGYRAQTATVCTLDITNFDLSSTYYLFVLRGSASSIYKITEEDGVHSKINKEGSNFNVSFSDTSISSSDSSYNGGIIFAVRFPHYTSGDVLELLAGMTFVRKAARNSTSAAAVSFAANEVNSNAVYLSCFTNLSGTPRNGVSFSAGDSIFSPLRAWYDDDNTQGGVGTKNYAFLYQSGSTIYSSLNGTSQGGIRNGGIYELTYTAST